MRVRDVMLMLEKRIITNVCRLVAELVGADKRVLGEVFLRLEQQSANPGIDVRLTGEIYGKLHMKMRSLGLDPNDTTPHELYNTLLSLVARHDFFLAKRLGVDNIADSAEIAQAVVTVIQRLGIPKQSWAFKSTTAKRLLKAMPPKSLMKLLHYRSVDSMLKREPSTVILAIARHVESPQWQRRFVQGYKNLKSNDFEVRDIDTLYLAHKKWDEVSQFFVTSHRSNIVHSEEVGLIVLLKLNTDQTTGITLASLLLALHYINEIRAFSTYCKFHHMRPDFGNLLIKHRLNENPSYAQLAGQSMHWRVIHRYFGTVDRMNHPEIFEPHVQPEDLSYRRAEETLYHLEPALHFWHDMDYVGLPNTSGPISFNLTDMAMNLINKLPFEKRAFYHMQDALWNEIYARYIGQPAFERKILEQLDEGLVDASHPAMDLEFVV